MPYSTEKQKLGSEFLDKRTKLLPCQKERIFQMYHKEGGFSQRGLAKMFGVSRRTIQFILDPEKLTENKKRREERGGTKIYYDREKNNAYQNKHRKDKHKLLTGIKNSKKK